jgi:hypothetical protein
MFFLGKSGKNIMHIAFALARYGNVSFFRQIYVDLDISDTQQRCC